MRRFSCSCYSHDVRSRIYLSLHNWWCDGRCSCKCRTRCGVSRYVLRSGSLSLRPFQGCCLCHFRRFLLLNRKNDRNRIQRGRWSNSFLNVLWGRKSDVLSHALFRPRRKAASYLRLSRRVRRLKFRSLSWIHRLCRCISLLLLSRTQQVHSAISCRQT